jgi:hypothetical protein
VTGFVVYLMAGLLISWCALMNGNKHRGWLIEIIAILLWPGMFILGFVTAWRHVRSRR